MNDFSSNREGREDPRVRFAAERTLLAWMRTGLALMGFGFVVARFGLFLQELALADNVIAHQRSTGWSLWLGLGLIALGIAASLAASFEYFRFVRLAKKGINYAPRTALLAVVITVILAILGFVMAVYLVVMNT